MKNIQAFGKTVNALTKVYVILIFTILTLYCISLLFPLFWMVISSVKDEIDYTLNTFGFPSSLNFDNYTRVFALMKARVYKGGVIRMVGFGEMAFYSILRATVTSLTGVFVTACVAYVMSKYRFFGNRFLYALGIVIMIVPIVGSLPSAMMLHKALGTYDNLFRSLLIIPSTPFSGLYFLILYAACKAIPKDYMEAGFIDGAGHYTAMFRLMMPMIIPTCVTLFVLTFLGQWNDYETFLIWYPSTPNLALGLYYFQNNSSAGSEGATVPQILAGFVIVIVPTATLYLSTQKIITSKFTVGGLKG